MGVSKVNKLKDLIHELCPNGVEYKKLADCCVLEKGNTPIQKAIPGEFPLVVTTEERKSCNTYQFDKPTVCIPLVPSRGHGVASLNSLYYQEGSLLSVISFVVLLLLIVMSCLQNSCSIT